MSSSSHIPDSNADSASTHQATSKATAPSAHTPASPPYSSWFRVESVHSLEKEAFSDLFSSLQGDFDESQYREYRNLIINLYNMKPDTYLSITICRRNITCDLAYLARIHSFLEHWGLINSRTALPHKPVHGFNFKSTEQAKRSFSEEDGSIHSSLIEISCSSCSKPIQTITGYVYRTRIEDSAPRLICEPCLVDLKTTDPRAASLFEVYKYVQSALDLSFIDMERLLDLVNSHGSDWWSVGDALNISPENAMQAFLSISLGDGIHSKTEHNFSSSDPVSFVENPSQVLIHMLASQMSSSFAASLARRHLEGAPKETVETVENSIKENASRSLAHESENFNQLKQKLLECCLRRVSLKVKYLEDLENALQREKGSIERQRLQIFMERYNLKRSLLNDPSSNGHRISSVNSDRQREVPECPKE